MCEGDGAEAFAVEVTDQKISRKTCALVILITKEDPEVLK